MSTKAIARAAGAALSEDRIYPLSVVKELAELEASLGGRPRLLQLLALAPQTKLVQRILGLLGDPRQDGLSLAEVCRMGRALPAELLQSLAHGAMAKAHLLATDRIAQGTPAVVGDVMKRAAPYEDACMDCRGIGTLTPEPTTDQPNPIPGPCETCNGTGLLGYPADPRCRELALDLAKLLPQSGGGINIALTQNTLNMGSGSGTFERMQEAMDLVIYGRGEAVDAEPAAPASPVTPPVTPPASSGD